jgi:hypothetical protein
MVTTSSSSTFGCVLKPYPTLFDLYSNCLNLILQNNKLVEKVYLTNRIHCSMIKLIILKYIKKINVILFFF